MAHFKNKVIAITGAASGIGFATAKKLAGQGALLSLADRDGDRLKTVVPILAALHLTSIQEETPNGQASRPETPLQQPSISASTMGNSSPNGPLSRPEFLTTTLDITDGDDCDNSPLQQVGPLFGELRTSISEGSQILKYASKPYTLQKTSSRHFPVSSKSKSIDLQFRPLDAAVNMAGIVIVVGFS